MACGGQPAEEEDERDPRDAELVAALAIHLPRAGNDRGEADRRVVTDRVAPDVDDQPSIPREVGPAQKVEPKLLVVAAAR
jgi:hypothetical protein